MNFVDVFDYGPGYLDELLNEARPTVTSLYALKDPAIKSPKDAINHLFKTLKHQRRSGIDDKIFDFEVTPEKLDILARCGRFPQRPSNLFLKIYHGVLCTLEPDPLAGCVSPRLIGVSGIIPLTIISTVSDIMRHYHHIIVNAEKEVLFATCWWQKGETSNMMNKALRDLNQRASLDKRCIIVKIMIDHFTKENMTHSHTILPPKKWTHCGIPPPEELPFLSLEVNCYHRIVLGTFHSKFLVVDRKIALLNSNNIYDRPNLEMMIHYEGNIVDSFYDTFLITWQLPFNPDLVCLQEEASVNNSCHFATNNETTAKTHPHMNSADNHPHLVASSLCSSDHDKNSTSHKTQSCVVQNSLSKRCKAHSSTVLDQIPIDVEKTSADCPTSFLFLPSLTTHLNGLSPSAQGTRPAANLSNEEIEKLKADFTPFIFHTPHQPVPIALVSRSCYGTPGHSNIANPQNAAWLGAFQYAQRSIFIQSPMFNASRAIESVLSACRRGVKVTLWLDLGYDAWKEGFGTFQGGTNEHVAKKLYRQLNKRNDGAVRNLEVYWYTAKDQTHPFHFSQKQRNCHIKFMAIDDQVAIIGSGNIDTQSWCHSQEINTMIDSPLLVKEWIDALYRNQSTNEYGKLDDHGRW